MMFASDLDGTLLDTHHRLDDVYLPTLTYLKNKNIPFVVASGRSLQSIQKVLNHITLPFCKVGLNGAIAVNENGECLYEVTLPLETSEKLIQLSNSLKIPIVIYTREKAYTTTSNVVFENFHKQLQPSFTGSSREFYEEYYLLNTLHHIDSYQTLLGGDEKIFKIDFFPANATDKQNFLREIVNVPDIAYLDGGISTIEITNNQAKKGIALQSVVSYLNKNKDEVVVFGDNENDISMFERFPNSYAMENAKEYIKEKATNIASSNAEFGVLKVLESYIKKFDL